eukprot:COSAG01_NODE_1261_length_11001_cov_11.811961_4_plen_91_part_00
MSESLRMHFWRLLLRKTHSVAHGGRDTCTGRNVIAVNAQSPLCDRCCCCGKTHSLGWGCSAPRPPSRWSCGGSCRQQLPGILASHAGGLA